MVAGDGLAEGELAGGEAAEGELVAGEAVADTQSWPSSHTRCGQHCLLTAGLLARAVCSWPRPAAAAACQAQETC